MHMILLLILATFLIALSFGRLAVAVWFSLWYFVAIGYVLSQIAFMIGHNLSNFLGIIG
jgi:hypothetical protein